MSKSTLSAQMTRRLIEGYRRNAVIAADYGNPERVHAERRCGAIAQRLQDGGRGDIASDLFAETVVFA